MGHAGSKTRSSAQILEKPCVRSRGHIFSQIIMTLSQNILLDKILDDLSLEKDHVGSKTRSLVQMLKKPCVCSRGHFQTDNHETWSELLS